MLLYCCRNFHSVLRFEEYSDVTTDFHHADKYFSTTGVIFILLIQFDSLSCQRLVSVFISMTEPVNRFFEFSQ